MQQRFPSFKTIVLAQKGTVVHISLNRPRVGNRVNRAMVEEMAEAASLINQDDSLRVVKLTGRGQVFSTGWERPIVRHAHELVRYQAARAIAGIQKPVVAAINGDAIGQGLELALAADIRIATTTARFGMPQVRSTVIPWDGGTQRLARLVGRSAAIALLLTGEVINAYEALRIGLISRAMEPAEFENAVESLVLQVESAGPIALRYAKETVAKGLDMSLEQGLRLEADLNILLHGARDRAEGIRSFLERRPPRFRGR